MNELTLNKQRSKLKNLCFQMPKISYCNRWRSLEEKTEHRNKTDK